MTPPANGAGPLPQPAKSAPPDAGPLPRPVDGEHWVVSAVIMDERGRAFVQRRAPHRRLFPGCWDLVGGHVEPGETLMDALRREITEETGWRLRRVREVLAAYKWTGADGERRREVAVVAEVDGDLAHPRIERDRNRAYAWIDRAGLPRLLEGRAPDDTVIHDVVARALA